MRSQSGERRLTTILAADVVGYSRLMAGDESGTLDQLKAHRRDLIEPMAATYGGRVVKLMGDGILMEFGSVVDALQFAVDVQRATADRNASIPEDRQITFRVGINIGDIIVDGDDIYGDGVNVAARIEGLAEPGGVSISHSVYSQVRGKTDLGFEDLGEQSVKNIPEPVHVFRVVLDPDVQGSVVGAASKKSRWRIRGAIAGGAALLIGTIGVLVWPLVRPPADKPVTMEGLAFPLPDKPSIAVLPFTNMSNDPEQDYFVDGMTSDLITDLSRVSALFVIARNSVFTYKGRSVNVKQVSRELGVRYVLEGSVRKSGGRLRINTELVDAATRGHVWAERFDREYKDVFALQDEVVGKIVSALKVRLTEGEKRYALGAHSTNFETYDVYLRGLREFVRRSKDGNHAARSLFEEAIGRDPQFAHAHAHLAWAHARDYIDGWSENADTSLQLARAMAQRAVDLDESLPLAHFVMGFIHVYAMQHEQALGSMQRALELDPNYSDAYAVSARVLYLAGRPEEGFAPINMAMRLNPHRPQAYFFILGGVYFSLGRYEEAADVFKKALERNPTAQRPRMWLVATYAKLGLLEDAEWEAEELLTLDPDFSVLRISRALPFKNPEHLQALLDGLRNAGLPD